MAVGTPEVAGAVGLAAGALPQAESQRLARIRLNKIVTSDFMLILSWNVGGGSAGGNGHPEGQPFPLISFYFRFLFRKSITILRLASVQN
jgi:hypothetical protein